MIYEQKNEIKRCVLSVTTRVVKQKIMGENKNKIKLGADSVTTQRVKQKKNEREK